MYKSHDNNFITESIRITQPPSFFFEFSFWANLELSWICNPVSLFFLWASSLHLIPTRVTFKFETGIWCLVIHYPDRMAWKRSLENGFTQFVFIFCKSYTILQEHPTQSSGKRLLTRLLFWSLGESPSILSCYSYGWVLQNQVAGLETNKN